MRIGRNEMNYGGARARPRLMPAASLLLAAVLAAPSAARASCGDYVTGNKAAVHIMATHAPSLSLLQREDRSQTESPPGPVPCPCRGPLPSPPGDTPGPCPGPECSGSPPPPVTATSVRAGGEQDWACASFFPLRLGPYLSTLLVNVPSPSPCRQPTLIYRPPRQHV
jgi:hypothetical protein